MVSLPFVPSITPANVVVSLPAVVSVFVALVVLSVILAAESVVSEVAIDATVSSNPLRSKIALFAMDTADESEIRPPAVPNFKVPTDTVVAPLYVFTPDKVNVPSPDFVRPPVVVAIAPLIVEVPTESTVRVRVSPVKPPDNVNDEPVSICTSELANNVTAPEIVLVPLVLRIAPTLEVPAPVISIGSKTVTPFEIDNVALFSTVVLPRVPAFSPSAVLLLIATTPVEIVVLPVYVLALESVSVLADDVFFVNVPEPVIIPDNV